MDADSKKILDNILAKMPGQLTEEEKAILRARRSYLTRSQEEDFITILNQTPKGAVKKDAKPSKTNKGRVTSTRARSNRRGGKTKKQS